MTFNGIEVLDVVWFDEFGFVKGKDIFTHEIKIYAGKGQGLNEKDDIEYIMAYGHKYSVDDFIALCNRFSIIQ